MAEGKQGRHVPDMTRQRIPGSCCSRRKHAVTQCRTASCRHQQSRRVSRSEMTPRSKVGNWTNGLGKVAWHCAVKTAQSNPFPQIRRSWNSPTFVKTWITTFTDNNTYRLTDSLQLLCDTLHNSIMKLLCQRGGKSKHTG